jgi:Leucine-rich repeat (LRR) protein
LSLTDKQVKNAIDSLPSTTPVDTFYLQGNALTFIPSGLTQFTQLTTIDLSGNQITAINTAELTLSAAVISLDLSSNLIAQIASGSLPSK